MEAYTNDKLIQMIQLMLAHSGQENFVSNGGKLEWKGQRIPEKENQRRRPNQGRYFP